MSSRSGVLIVTIDGTRRTLPAPAVREITQLGMITPIPGAPSIIRGVTALRGQILPVLHAGEGRPPVAAAGTPMIVLALTAGRAPNRELWVCLLVEQVAEFESCAPLDALPVDLEQWRGAR